MARIPDAEIAETERYVKQVLESQERTWGAPLLNRTHYNDDAIVELTTVIAWENASSKFNRALRVPSQRLWTRQ